MYNAWQPTVDGQRPPSDTVTEQIKSFITVEPFVPPSDDDDDDDDDVKRGVNTHRLISDDKTAGLPRTVGKVQAIKLKFH